MNFAYGFQDNSGSPDAKEVGQGRKKRPTDSPSPESKTKQVRYEQDDTSNEENIPPPKNRDVSKTAQKEGEHSETEQNGGGKEEAKESTANNENAEYWEKLVNGSGTIDREAPNLEAFLATKSSRDISTERFMAIMEEGEKSMIEAIENMLRDLVVPYHADRQARTDTFEESIKSLMTQNHEQRKSMENSLIQAGTSYKMVVERLLHEVRKTSPPVDKEGSDQLEDSPKKSPSKSDDGGSNEGEEEDLNWDEIVEFSPMPENIRSFRETRERLRLVKEEFGQALDEINSGLKREVEDFFQMAATFANERGTILNTLEDEIQFNLISNHRRGCEYQKRVEESKNDMQSFFAKLMAQIGRGRS